MSKSKLSAFTPNDAQTLLGNGDAATFDSVVGNGNSTPAALGEVFDRIDEAAGDKVKASSAKRAVFDSLRAGAAVYKETHGIEAPADLLAHVLSTQHQGTFDPLALKNGTLDSASSSAHDAYSLMPNRIVAATIAQFQEAIPFGGYLPVDIGSNEAIIGIVSHRAGSSFGNYAKGASLNGLHAGNQYLSGTRLVLMGSNGGTGLTRTVSCQFGAAGSANEFIPAAVSGDNPVLPLIRGRTAILVNGLPVARENGTSGSGNSTFAGTATIAGVSYAISGTVNPATGDIVVNSAPDLPANTKTHAVVVIDFEQNVALVPKVSANADTDRLYATPSHGSAELSMSARTQFTNELGLDVRSETLISLRSQFAAERHYEALRYMVMVAQGQNQYTYDFNWAAQSLQKTRMQTLRDIQVVVGQASQEMANRNQDAGITHIYVSGIMQALFNGLDTDDFVKSGLPEKAGIYRMGRWLNKYEVYYTPKGLPQTSTSSAVLCIGRGSQTAFSPILLGDAVSPILIPASTNSAAGQTDAFYARTFTELHKNPVYASSAAIINVTNTN